MRPREEWDTKDGSSLANPQNVNLSTYRGPDAMKRKYGPAVMGEAPAENTAPAVEEMARAHHVESHVAAQLVQQVKEDKAADQAARAAAAVAAAHAPPALADEIVKHGKLSASFGREEIPTPGAVVAPTPAKTPTNADLPGVIDEVKRYGPLAQSGDANAAAQLERIAAEEFTREGGPRMPVTKRLAAYGVKKPAPRGEN